MEPQGPVHSCAGWRVCDAGRRGGTARRVVAGPRGETAGSRGCCYPCAEGTPGVVTRAHIALPGTCGLMEPVWPRRTAERVRRFQKHISFSTESRQWTRSAARCG